MKTKWSTHLTELFMVTLGVLLAFALSAWWENRNEKKSAQSDLESIHEEIHSNTNAVNKALCHHMALKIEIDSCPTNVILQLRPARVRNIAWNSTKKSQLKDHLDREQYMKLVYIYQQHEMLLKHSNMASNLMGELNVFSPYYEVQALEVMMNQELSDRFRTRRRQSWRPVFSDWISLELEYIHAIREYERNQWNYANYILICRI